MRVLERGLLATLREVISRHDSAAPDCWKISGRDGRNPPVWWFMGGRKALTRRNLLSKVSCFLQIKLMPEFGRTFARPSSLFLALNHQGIDDTLIQNILSIDRRRSRCAKQACFSSQ
jgi:hypothetical protein